MVYDPIRDRDVPSPAISKPSPSNDWGRVVQGSSTVHYQDPRVNNPDGVRAPPPSHPPDFQPTARRPSPSSYPIRSVSVSGSGGLRGLLNDEPLVRPSIGLGTIEKQRKVSGQSGGISKLLNTETASINNTTNSSSTLTPSSLTANNSPVPQHEFLDPNGLVIPGHPSRQSRSPHLSLSSVSPVLSHASVPQYEDSNHHSRVHPYHTPQAQPSNGSSYRAPPQSGPSNFANSVTQQPFQTPQTQLSHHRPMMPPEVPRFQSISVSPRSQPQTLPQAPHANPTSRPTSSSAASQVFYFAPPPAQTPEPSPARTLCPSSEEYIPPSARQTNNVPVRHVTAPSFREPRFSHTPSATSVSVRSPSPINKVMYHPARLKQPTSVLVPILPPESEQLRISAMSNNPLRKKARRPLPSWSVAPSSRLSGPQESDSSYFPTHDDLARRSQGPGSRRGSASERRRPSITPGPLLSTLLERPDSRKPTPRVVSGETEQKAGKQLKRSSEGEEPEREAVRRKVSGSLYVGNTGAIASHYNARPEVGVEHRELSPIIGLKKFNNWIKSVLIGKFAYRRRNGPGANVLDLGCGKGGDLNKWKQAHIRLYVGLDIATTSIEQAEERYRKLGNRAGFDGYFYASDCFANPISDVLPPDLAQEDLYDNVTMQFCMHYAFENASKARMMMENVSRYLRPGGVLIGTIPDADLLLDRLHSIPEDAEDLRFGNSCYYVRFNERRHKGLYGHEYRFYLTDAVEDVPEYLVDWKNFVALAAEYRLRLIYKKPFHSVLEEEQSSRDFGPLLGKMGVLDHNGHSAMDADQWEAANLYLAFAFEKI
ncbi:hypothetical protein TREMEDRAFT_71716 [Tremella mesenterica DSM 1558]|uniref:uncharacterized protein n=1 Tax=Tremella mesenterica (strain ATCC 24925 / CBS 8224 / DSM 1558 / NBRC 9311 / NRRL Y-6157 / RJB 2259-6 / UBC 559-6) TaxID=578456 RepID=UPI0003F499D0|nr:uncharacterized protein TREMEDRAFT_71716 [Tremella mesenterica DSM 1558]EIW68861.1 hypothetical protein TREMEDRAFT_71716 [Tremella mesenterica DSM 1558]